jgi:hypothetical protein
MYEVLGSVIGILLILALCSPIILAVYMWNTGKIDIDKDGKEDLPNRWGG